MTSSSFAAWLHRNGILSKEIKEKLSIINLMSSMIQAASKEQNSIQIQVIQQFSKIAFQDHLWEAGTLSKFIEFWKL